MECQQLDGWGDEAPCSTGEGLASHLRIQPPQTPDSISSGGMEAMCILHPPVLAGVGYCSIMGSSNPFPFSPIVLLHGEWTVAGKLQCPGYLSDPSD